MKWVYRITYPNGKIYVGKDLTGSVGYFGSPSSEYVAKDFTFEQMKDMTIRREIIWSSETATDEEVNKKEVELILANDSNNPFKGYNKLPKHKGTPNQAVNTDPTP
jgi:hypothetical protein